MPNDIVKTKERPDIVSFPCCIKKKVLALTVTWQKAVNEVYERNRLQYADLVKDGIANRWDLSYVLSCRSGSKGLLQNLW